MKHPKENFKDLRGKSDQNIRGFLKKQQKQVKDVDNNENIVDSSGGKNQDIELTGEDIGDNSDNTNEQPSQLETGAHAETEDPTLKSDSIEDEDCDTKELEHVKQADTEESNQAKSEQPVDVEFLAKLLSKLAPLAKL